MAVQFYLVA